MAEKKNIFWVQIFNLVSDIFEWILKCNWAGNCAETENWQPWLMIFRTHTCCITLNNGSSKTAQNVLLVCMLDDYKLPITGLINI